MKFTSDPTRAHNFRFVARIDDADDSGARFSIRLVNGSGNHLVVGEGGTASAANAEIDQLVELLLQAKNMLTKFSYGTRDFTEPPPEQPAKMPKIGGGSA